MEGLKNQASAAGCLRGGGERVDVEAEALKSPRRRRQWREWGGCAKLLGHTAWASKPNPLSMNATGFPT